jgi:hypothetical protein
MAGQSCNLSFEAIQGILYATLANEGIDPSSPGLVDKTISQLLANAEGQRTRESGEWLELKQRTEAFLDTSNSSLQSAIVSLGERSTEAMTRLDNEANAAISQIQTTDATYKEHMKLRAPVEYWRSKATAHQDALWWSRLRLILFVAIFTTSLVGSLILLADHASGLAEKNPASATIVLLKYSAIAVVITTIIFMVGRMLLRIYLSDRHLLTDAEERIAMIQTYLALSHEGKVGETDRALILAPLFRTAADGIIKDEGMESSIVGLLAKGVEKLK